MRAFWGFLFVLVVASGFAACSLNPHPLPPGMTDETNGAADASRAPPHVPADATIGDPWADVAAPPPKDDGSFSSDGGDAGVVDCGTDADAADAEEEDAGEDEDGGSTESG